MSLFCNLTLLVPECYQLKETQLSYLLNNDTQKALLARQKVLFFTLQTLDHCKITDIHHAKVVLEKHLMKNTNFQWNISAVLSEKSKFVTVLELFLKIIKQNQEKKSKDSLGTTKKSISGLATSMEKVHISTETRNHVPIDEKYSELVSKHQILIQKVQQIETEKVQLQSKLESIESLYSELIIGKENVDKQNRSLSKKYNQLTIQKSIVYQSQIIQLKRQLDKYKQVANKKELFVYSAQEQVFMCLEKARSLESLISDKPALEGLIKRLQALSKHITRSERDHIESIEPNAFHFISDFLHGHKEITMNDVCSGSTSHINIENISRLEIQLFTLYTKLSHLEACFSTCLEPNIAPLFTDRIDSLYHSTMEELIKSMNCLVSLSALVPTCPTPGLKVVPSQIPSLLEKLKQIHPPITEPLTQKIVHELDPIVDHLQKIISFQKQDINCLNKELDFHRQLYKKYTNGISQLVNEVKQERITIKNEIHKVHDLFQKLLYGIETLEWKEEIVTEFLVQVEETIKESTTLLQSLISNENM